MGNAVGHERARVVPVETAYQLELAVGASHIASMLSSASRGACIEDVVTGFVAKHGRTDLTRFLARLAERLEVRKDREGVLAIRHFAEFGALPVAPLTGASVGALKKVRSAATPRT